MLTIQGRHGIDGLRRIPSNSSSERDGAKRVSIACVIGSILILTKSLTNDDYFTKTEGDGGIDPGTFSKLISWDMILSTATLWPLFSLGIEYVTPL